MFELANYTLTSRFGKIAKQCPVATDADVWVALGIKFPFPYFSLIFRMVFLFKKGLANLDSPEES